MGYCCRQWGRVLFGPSKHGVYIRHWLMGKQHTIHWTPLEALDHQHQSGRHVSTHIFSGIAWAAENWSWYRHEAVAENAGSGIALKPTWPRESENRWPASTLYPPGVSTSEPPRQRQNAAVKFDQPFCQNSTHYCVLPGSCTR